MLHENQESTNESLRTDFLTLNPPQGFHTNAIKDKTANNEDFHSERKGGTRFQFASSSSSGESGAYSSTTEPLSPSNNDASNKRNRASWQQRILLERVFQSNQYPNQAVRNQLAQQLGMSPRKIQIWFQNRRTKAKTAQHEEQHQLHLLSKGVDPSDVNIQQQPTGNTLLHIAAATDHPAIQSLLAKGANCNIANKHGNNDFHCFSNLTRMDTTLRCGNIL